MNIVDIATAVKTSNRKLSTQDSKSAVIAVFEALKKDLVKGNNTTIIGFGTFSVKDRQSRMGRNPQTGEALKIPASKTATFKVSKVFKDSLN